MKDTKKMENKGKAVAAEEKAVSAPAMGEDKAVAKPDLVRVRVRPFRGVGGIGGPGAVKEIPAELAKSLAKDGFVDILKEEDK
ncbi:MAG TPA: hypothetical protein ENJ54_04305 [Chloroflexi bacterium]|nr:hypothetical protein [Chloroflexota bacterium]